MTHAPSRLARLRREMRASARLAAPLVLGQVASMAMNIVDTTLQKNGLGVYVNAAAVVAITRVVVEQSAQTGVLFTAGSSGSITDSTIANNTVTGVAVLGHASGSRASRSSLR